MAKRPEIILIATRGPLQSNGLYDIKLDAWQIAEKSNYLGRLLVNSGAPTNQVFTTVPTATPGTLQPCPEGEFDLGPLEWAGRKGDFNTNFKEIDSPIWMTIFRARAIGFHLDGNRLYAPGSAGCLVFKNMTDLQTFVRWGYFGDLKKLYVDWNKRYVNIPDKYKQLRAAL